MGCERRGVKSHWLEWLLEVARIFFSFPLRYMMHRVRPCIELKIHDCTSHQRGHNLLVFRDPAFIAGYLSSLNFLGESILIRKSRSLFHGWRAWNNCHHHWVLVLPKCCQLTSTSLWYEVRYISIWRSQQGCTYVGSYDSLSLVKTSIGSYHR